MTKKFLYKKALILGGSSGLGKEIVKKLKAVVKKLKLYLQKILIHQI